MRGDRSGPAACRPDAAADQQEKLCDHICGAPEVPTPRLIAMLGGMRRGILVLVLFGSWFAAPAMAQENQEDPLEPFNRAMFTFNDVLDGLFLRPAAIMYRNVFPGFVRDGVSNFLDNVRTPVVLANDLLQGEWKRAEHTLGRFMFNTIMGLGGLIDVGGYLGMPERHDEDFGQTLAVYGVDSGPYLVLPIVGPSSPRHAFGLLVDAFAFDPFSIFFSDVVPLEARLAERGARYVTFREANLENIDELKRTSLDYYAAVRTVWWQLREAEIRNGAPPPLEDIYDEDIYDEDLYDQDLVDPEENAGAE